MKTVRRCPPFWFYAVMMAKFDDGLNYYFFRDTAVLQYWIKWQTWFLSSICLKNVSNIKHIGQKSK